MRREFLQNFKVGEQPLPKEIIDAIMAENGTDIEAAKAKFADYDSLKTKLEEAGKTIEGFKGMDIDAVRREADDWKTKYEQEQVASAAKLADMAFESLLTGAITEAKGRSPKAVSALLDVEALKSSKNQEADIKAALESLQKENGYLFETEVPPAPYAAGTGTQGGFGTFSKETFGKMGYQERLALKKEHPDIYEKVKE